MSVSVAWPDGTPKSASGGSIAGIDPTTTSVLVMQTADPFLYKQMLDITSEVNREYCLRWSIRYESYIGIKLGVVPWQATYNRIFMLQELLQRRYAGWVAFLDADALFCDLSFDLRSYLGENRQYCLIGTEGGEADWNINAGVFFIDLGDFDARRLCSEWLVRFYAEVPSSYLKSKDAKWDEYPNDQHLLHELLIDDGIVRRKTKKAPLGLFNYNGSVIRQALRDGFPDIASRTKWLQIERDRILARKSPLDISGFPYVDLTDLANRNGSDKGDQIGNAHSYTLYYQFLFEAIRFDEFDFLEIGLLRGGPEVGIDASRTVSDAPSVRMWLDYFPHAVCHGADISDFSALECERFKFHWLDAGSLKALIELRDSLPQLRFVIDDASHASYHQQLSFSVLFPCVESGGLYIIEDLDWQPEEYSKTLPPCGLTTTLLWDFKRTGTLTIPFLSAKANELLAQQIGRVYFLRRRGDGTARLAAIEKRR